MTPNAGFVQQLRALEASLDLAPEQALGEDPALVCRGRLVVAFSCCSLVLCHSPSLALTPFSLSSAPLLPSSACHSVPGSFGRTPLPLPRPPPLPPPPVVLPLPLLPDPGRVRRQLRPRRLDRSASARLPRGRPGLRRAVM